jgi:hypothetical protein
LVVVRRVNAKCLPTYVAVVLKWMP